MRKVCFQRWLISSLFILLFACQNKKVNEVSLPYYNQADFTPIWPNENKIDKLHTIGEFALQNQNAELITNTSLKGKIYVADFFFTICPSICPKMTSNLSIIATEFASDTSIQLVSFSVMPWVDSVDVLNEFALSHNIDSNQWNLLTGETEVIYNLARQSFFAEKEIGLSRNSNEFLHTENFILVDGDGHIRGVYNGTIPLEMIRLSQDIRTLKALG